VFFTKGTRANLIKAAGTICSDFKTFGERSMKKMLELACGVSLAACMSAGASAGIPASAPYHHVLLISIDGMHAVDLQNYIAAHPGSTLAQLASHGVRFPNALTTAPSDSFPGLLAQVTGGTSRSTGVFYDVSYDRTLFAPGSNCVGAPGTQPAFDESLDNDPTSFTAGGTPGDVHTQINVANLPLALVGGVCTPVWPHQFIKVNTIFEVIKARHGRTAWADKHPAYDIVNGPSGAGVDDLYTVEVNSNDSVTGQDTTTGFHSVERNDQLKVDAVLNEIAGLDSTGAHTVGVPAIFGMNFQAVSVGEKLKAGNPNDPQDAGLIGGYADAVGASPNNGLELGLDYVDHQLGGMVAALNCAGIEDDTLIIISAKHGQSPIDITTKVAVDDGPYGATPGFSASITDDVGLVWLDPASQKSDYDAAKAYLLSQAGPLHIDTLLDKDQLAPLFHSPFGNNRTPDFIAITHPGVIYTHGSKLAEHGGFALNDRNVALLVSNPSLSPKVLSQDVETKQIAPTILKALGLPTRDLQAVFKERTRTLPGLGL
jgi:predicted AlkP superfamily pyrophosphatase or phosphodiesterase